MISDQRPGLLVLALAGLLLRLERIYRARSGRVPSHSQRPSSKTHIKNKGIGVSEHSVSLTLFLHFVVSHIQQSGWLRPQHGPSQLDSLS